MVNTSKTLKNDFHKISREKVCKMEMGTYIARTRMMMMKK